MAQQTAFVIASPEEAHAYLSKAQNLADLRAAASAPAFQDYSKSLESEELEGLREHYRNLQALLQNRVKAADISGKPITVEKLPRFLTVDGRPSFVIQAKLDDKDIEFWCPGSAQGRPFRFFQDRQEPRFYPLRVVLTLGPHPQDPQKSLWDVQELAPERNRQTAIPF